MVLGGNKRMLNNVLVALVMLVLSVSCAHADPFGGRHPREGGRQQGGQMQPQPPRDFQRGYSPSGERRENMGPQRLSPDERRQLRRDIQDAGRDIYPPRR